MLKVIENPTSLHCELLASSLSQGDKDEMLALSGEYNQEFMPQRIMHNCQISDKSFAIIHNNKRIVYAIGGYGLVEGRVCVWFLTSFLIEQADRRYKRSFIKILKEKRDEAFDLGDTLFNIVSDANVKHIALLHKLGATFMDFKVKSQVTGEKFIPFEFHKEDFFN